MLNKLDVYNKIKDIYPDIGEFEKDIQIEFNEKEHAWIVDLKEGRKHLKTYLEEADAEVCIGKNQCFGLGLQIGQLKDNIKIM